MGDRVAVRVAAEVPLWPSVTLTLLTVRAGNACTVIVLLVATGVTIRSLAKNRT